MKIVKSLKQLNHIVNRFKKKGKRIGFVPTMGDLHEGHLSLVRRARRETDFVIVSVFVNPTQFGSKEDFKHYPRNLKRDKQLLSSEKVDYLFLPSRFSIYPKGFQNYLEPGLLAHPLCGAKRPGHFRGVVTVVNRLFEIVQPDYAYFGEKDYQQVKVIQDMVKTRNLSVHIRTCPIVREKDGLAMSSRNRHLSKTERIRARALSRSLKEAKKIIQGGRTNSSQVKKRIRTFLKSYVDKIDYVELADPNKLTPLKRLKPPILVVLACFVGPTRLIDNLVVKR